MYKRRIGVDARLMLRLLRGMPLYVFRICQYLPALNRDYQFVLFINKGYEYNDAPENYQLRINEIEENNSNVKFVNCNHRAEILWEQIYLPILLKRHKIELLHMPGNRICFTTCIPTVVTVHDIIEYASIINNYKSIITDKSSSIRMKFFRIRKMLYTWLIYRYGFRNAAKVITVSNYSAKEIVKFLKMNPEKVTAIHHGLDEEFVLDDNEGSEISLSHNNYEVDNYVLMLGGDSPHKNPEGIIASWAKVSNRIRKKYSLKVIGFCGNDQSPLLLALQKYGLQDDVEVLGWVSKEEMIYHMRTAALFIFLSRHEGFGFPILHAMASGTPVVSSDRTSIPEILGDVGLKYDPDDHCAVAKGIEMVLDDPELWQQQACAGRARAKKFSWQQSNMQHLKVYESVLGE